MIDIAIVASATRLVDFLEGQTSYSPDHGNKTYEISLECDYLLIK